MKRQAFKKSLPSLLLWGMAMLLTAVASSFLYDFLLWLVPENLNHFFP